MGCPCQQHSGLSEDKSAESANINTPSPLPADNQSIIKTSKRSWWEYLAIGAACAILGYTGYTAIEKRG